MTTETVQVDTSGNGHLAAADEKIREQIENGMENPFGLSIPALPHIGLRENVQINPWLEKYIEYSSDISPRSPRCFHESAALWLLSVIVARRVKLHLAHENVYPNLFILWVAPTTSFSKTTTINIAKEILQRYFPHLLSPEETTPEAFFRSLSGIAPTNHDSWSQQDQDDWIKERDYCAQRGLGLDEMSGFFANSNRDYNRGILETFMKLYNCDPIIVRETIGSGRQKIRDSYLSLLGASTPSLIDTYLTSKQMWGSGWWPRFAILCPTEKSPSQKRSKDTPMPSVIINTLIGINKALPAWAYGKEHTTADCQIDTDAFNLFEAYDIALLSILDSHDIEDQYRGMYGRSTAKAEKVAMLLALLDWNGSGDIHIGINHATKGIQIAESWRECAYHCLDMVDDSIFDKELRRVLEILPRYNTVDGATPRDVQRHMAGKSLDHIKGLLRQLVEMELVNVHLDKHEGKSGRHADRYKLIGIK